MRSQGLLPFPTLPAALRYTIAFASVGLVFLADNALDPLIDDGSLFLLLGIAVMLSAWLAGTGPALAATVGGGILGAAHPGAGADDRATFTHLALFVVQGLLLTAAVAELRLSRHVAEQKARDAHEARRGSEAAGRMKDEFLATLSHELRTPLNAVLGWVHLLRTVKLDPATWARGLESVERNVRVQAQLTSNLLDVSKVLTGTLQMDPRRLSLIDVAEEAAMAARPAAQAKGVEVVTRLPDEPTTVLGDAARLRQIIWHLLANAVKFTPKGGEVGLAVERRPEHVLLTVRDSGPGIGPEFLPYVFDRFTQEDASPTRTAGGLGVGLSLVKGLVELHGGEITAGNREDGPGAVFSITLPRQLDPALVTPVRVAAAASPTSPPLDGIRVLVLDRDPDGRDVLRAVLQQQGAAVRTVESVADALEALEAWRPDALLTDSVNPAHDSYVLVGKVQWLEADRGGRIPAAALTAYGRTDDRVRRMLDAVHSDLPKPVDPAVLTAEIARLTGRERRRAARVH